MASFNDARIWFLNFGVLCSSACGGVAPEEATAKPSADTYAASAQVEPECPAVNEELIDLGLLDPDFNHTGSNGMAVNDHRTVVGLSSVGHAFHAFRWKADTGLVDLNPLGALGSRAVDVNEQEQVIGSTSNGRGVLWDAENRVHELGTRGTEERVAVAINNRGQVIGMAQEEGTGFDRPYIWDDQNGAQEIELPFPTDVTLTGINDSGVVVGFWRSRRGAFKWSKEDGMTELDISGGYWLIATGINNQGEVAGAVVENGEVVGVKWTGSEIVRLPSPLPNGEENRPVAINDRGAIAGNGRWTYTAVEWDPTLRVSLFPLDGVGNGASGLNNCGDVTGHYWAECRVQHAVLWRAERPAQ